jgi:hypothetical protein
MPEQPTPEKKKRSKLERLSAGALLLQQRAAKKAMAATVKRSAVIAVSSTTRQQSASDMSAELSDVIFDARQKARRSARGRLTAELKHHGVDLPDHRWKIGSRAEDDRRGANSAARSLSKQWIAIAAIIVAKRDTDKPIPLNVAAAAMASKVERTARTEVASAFSDEHAEALRDIVDYDRRWRDGELAALIEQKVVRQWNALLDACDRCWPYDGEQVGIDEEFPGGAVPGGQHPHCCCTEVLVERI